MIFGTEMCLNGVSLTYSGDRQEESRGLLVKGATAITKTYTASKTSSRQNQMNISAELSCVVDSGSLADRVVFMVYAQSR